ncbi:MAG: zinc metalloprotease [Planctomycetota bacterium]|jgi:hypothetical protein
MATMPTRRACGCLQAHFGLVDRYPAFKANQARIQDFTHRCVRGEVATREGITRIPVVVHVVHHTDAQNISDDQVHSQIATLNQDFRATNADLAQVPAPFLDLVADARIEFELASSAPDGDPTSGITRTRTDRASFSHVDDDVKSAPTGGIDPWDTREYLNIWVCTLGGGILGYAQFPGGPPETDGVVILHRAFGTLGTATAPFDQGRTTTHEIGHYLNLSHIWGESRFATCADDDYVSDTPVQLDKNFGKPAFPHFSCDGQPHGDMFMNYMDYVDDEAMFMFTKEQALRMAAALADPRKDLGTQVEEPAA